MNDDVIEIILELTGLPIEMARPMLSQILKKYGKDINNINFEELKDILLSESKLTLEDQSVSLH